MRFIVFFLVWELFQIPVNFMQSLDSPIPKSTIFKI